MNNIKKLFTLICRSSSIDRDTNASSVFEIVEEVTLNSVPNIPAPKPEDKVVINFPFELFCLWERKSDIKEVISSNVKVSLTDPSGNEKEQVTFPLQFELNKKRMRSRVKVQGLQFSGYGTYTFNVYLEQKGKFVKVQDVAFDLITNN